jgi:signal transduction histidine kinase
VRNSAGNPARSGSPSGTGHGLVGLQERARFAGGSLTSGPTPDGGYRLRAELPIGRSSDIEPQPILPATKGLM